MREDLEYWNELEEADLLWYNTHNMSRRENLAIDVIKNFSKYKCYLACSWGKDSVVVYHLAWRAGFKYEVVTAYADYKTRAANAMYLTDVRDSMPVRLNEVSLIYPEYPKGSKMRILSEYGKRYVSGIRSSESGARKISRNVHGVSTDNTCRPIIDWPSEAVFAYCANYNLPLHPNYGMLGGGRYNRNRLRVGGSIGGTGGDASGRMEWEREYYCDILRKIGLQE